MAVKRSNQGIDDKLKLKFTNLFLEATKELQRVKIWTDETRIKKTGKTEWDSLFEKTLKELFVLYGYFVEYEPYDEEVKYFIKGIPLNKANPDFIPPYIPYFENKNEELPKELFDSLRKAEPKFSTQLKSPKVFQHLPIQPKDRESFSDFNLISDKCLNCHVPCEIRSNNDYYVVLFDEVAFFQFAYKYLENRSNIYDYYQGQKETYLKYLLKFAIGIERKLHKDELWKHVWSDFSKLPIPNKKDWKTRKENSIRTEIEVVVENKKKDKAWLLKTDGILKKLVDSFIAKTKKDFEAYRNESMRDLEILEHISRFDIEASFEIKDKNKKPILHDVFVFPIYTQKTEKVFDIECVNGEKFDVHSPILLVLYIKTRKYIDGELDEDEGSVDGFQLTKEIAKVFAEKIIQEDYLKNVVRKETRPQATKATISDIINRNMAHHLTSHVSNRATLDKVLERLQKNYTDLSDASFYQTILDLLNRFNQYRDERSEYLTYITSFSSPSSAYFLQDVIRPFIENTLLMDNIAANENINYVRDLNGKLTNNKLQIKIKREVSKGNYESFHANYFDAKSKLYSSEELPYLRLKNDKLEYPYDRCELSHPDIEVSLPGTLGKHALYSILENFIRNSAKHGSEIKNSGLEIILLLSDENDDSISITLTDNCSNVSKEKVKEFNSSIQTEILERKDLGLIDMKVNACLLAGMELNDENCKKALNAFLHDGKLAYKFKIAKPKKAVFIGSFAKEEKNSNGFYYFETIEDFINSTISKSFEFAVVSDELFEQHGNSLASQLPARLLKLEEDNIDLDKAKSIEYLYEAWLKKLRGEERAAVHLFFEQNTNTQPTKEFLDKYEQHQNLKIYSTDDLSKDLTIDDTKNILFDRHGGLIKKFSADKSFVDTNHSWILIDKNNPDFDYISRYDIKSKDALLPYELEEAGLLKVLVIDERVAEQSVRPLESDSDAYKLMTERFEFEKFNLQSNLTLFDAAWAANVFLATHLNKNPLKQDIKLENQHMLHVLITDGKLNLETNITSMYASLDINKGEWNFGENTYTKSQTKTVKITPDVLILHRTKLKELISTDKDIVAKILSANPNLNIIVTTGSGTTHGIEGSYKILPFATLSNLVLGKRIQKLKLSRMVLQLSKNKI